MGLRCLPCHSTLCWVAGGLGRVMAGGDGMKRSQFVGSHIGGVGRFWGKWIAGRLGGDARQGADWG